MTKYCFITFCATAADEKLKENHDHLESGSSSCYQQMNLMNKNEIIIIYTIFEVSGTSYVTHVKPQHRKFRVANNKTLDYNIIFYFCIVNFYFSFLI